ncbi:MAG: DMT family transporter [Micropepsaceae bacterium]
MTGELIAFGSAVLYALSGVSIARGAPQARGDNGAFLSVVMTAAFSLAFWLLGDGPDLLAAGPAPWVAIALFIGSGLFSTVLGRVAMFRAVECGGAIRASMMRRLTPVFAALFAVLLLSELPRLPALAGMALILAGVAVLSRPGGDAGATRRNWAGWGAASAGSYGLAYVLRKMALIQLPGAAFGALVGAVTGLAWYLLAAPFSRHVRRAVTGLLRDSGRWQFVTATTMALAQIGQFMALQRSDVATVAVIGSTETVISIILASRIFGTESRPGALLWAGAILSTAGMVLISLSSNPA